MSMIKCDAYVDGYRTLSFANDALLTGESDTLVSAANGVAYGTYMVTFARITEGAGATVTLTSNGIGICPVANGEGEITNFLIQGQNLVCASSGGTSQYSVTIKRL